MTALRDLCADLLAATDAEAFARDRATVMAELARGRQISDISRGTCAARPRRSACW